MHTRNKVLSQGAYEPNVPALTQAPCTPDRSHKAYQYSSPGRAKTLLLGHIRHLARIDLDGDEQRTLGRRSQFRDTRPVVVFTRGPEIVPGDLQVFYQEIKFGSRKTTICGFCCLVIADAPPDHVRALLLGALSGSAVSGHDTGDFLVPRLY